jgi:hypothetical protein
LRVFTRYFQYFLIASAVSQAKLSPARTHEFQQEPRQIRRLVVCTHVTTGRLRLIYVPGKLIVDGNATATANNIAASETLFRLGIAAQLISRFFLFGWPWAVRLAHVDIDCGLDPGSGR